VKDTTFEWRNYRYFAYERDFALLEVERVFATPARENEMGLSIASSAYQPSAAERLTYFSRVISGRGEVVVPRQAKLEASATAHNSSRQATRYSAHSLHEYKGRFNPQVVRAIGNIIGVQQNEWVLDPFCGSGTTLLECAHAGWNSVGVDRNPLGVRISNSKLRALHSAERLARVSLRVVDDLDPYRGVSTDEVAKPSKLRSLLGDGWENEIASFQYMSEWFPLGVLAQIAGIRRVLSKAVRSREDRMVFEVILSDQLRDVSLQEPSDLRIRRRKDAQPNYPLIERFIAAVNDRLARISRARATLDGMTGSRMAFLGDNRSSDMAGRVPVGGFDAVITSPPYETALPYIDTQRLSLLMFDDLSPTEIPITERELIGAREISTRERRELESCITEGDENLPFDVMDLCRELLSAAQGSGNGFRRRNRPALTYRYFKNMAGFFAQLRQVVRPGAKVALVVGPSRTTLSGREYIIDTPRLLMTLGEHCGFSRLLERRMDAYQRYDLHQRNSIVSEMLIVLEAP
jgi:hypothetical protein